MWGDVGQGVLPACSHKGKARGGVDTPRAGGPPKGEIAGDCGRLREIGGECVPRASREETRRLSGIKQSEAPPPQTQSRGLLPYRRLPRGRARAREEAA